MRKIIEKKYKGKKIMLQQRVATITHLAAFTCLAFFHLVQATEREIASQHIPLSVLFSDPDMAAVKISPDGTRISYLAPNNNAMNIWVQKIDGSEKKCITAEERSIDYYFWSNILVAT
jgi:hypothetical protein